MTILFLLHCLKILLFIAGLNGLEVWSTDVVNANLEAELKKIFNLLQVLNFEIANGILH